MIAASSFDGKSVAVFGLGGSGVVVIEALQAGGAEVSAWDDNQGRVEALKSDDLPIVDLNEADFSKFDALVLAPGVPLTHPEPHWTVKKAQAAGIEIIGDVELFVRERANHAPEAPFIAITGTNGKSTTTALISHILGQAGRDVQMGGNIGRAVLSLDEPNSNKIYVVECSSYQIDLAPSLNPSVGILLNVTPDHLDRHGTIEHYAAVKEQLVQGADHAIVSVDDAFCLAIAERLSAEVMSTQGQADLYRDGTRLFHKGIEVANIAGIGSLRGDHNVQNALAALGACRQVGLSYAEIQAGFESFGGLPHRMEEVAQHGNILFVNDSKATNAEAAAKALGSFERIYWIAGGKAKSDGIDSLNEFFPRITETFLIGDASEQFAATLAGAMPTHQCGTLDVAVAKAAEAAMVSGEKGVVLLSPACASFDQFANFEVRGDAFRAAVNDFLDAL